MCMCPCCMHAFTQMYAWVHVDVPERVQVPRDWNVQVCVCAATAPKRRTLNPKYQICSNCTSKSNLLAKRDVRIILNEEKIPGRKSPPPNKKRKHNKQQKEKHLKFEMLGGQPQGNRGQPQAPRGQPRGNRGHKIKSNAIFKWNFERGHYVTPNIQRK